MSKDALTVETSRLMKQMRSGLNQNWNHIVKELIYIGNHTGHHL